MALINRYKQLFSSDVDNQHMSYSRIVAIITLIAGLVALVFYGQARLHSNPNGGGLENKPEMQASPEETQALPQPTAHDGKDFGTDVSSQLESGREYSEHEFRSQADVLAAQASSAEQVYGLIDTARAQGFDQVADELEIQLHHRCEGISSGRLANWQDEKTEGYRRLTRYCDSYVGVSSAIDEDVTAVIDHNHGPPAFSKLLQRYKSQFLEVLERAGTGSEEDAFLTYVAQVESPLELDGAKIGIRTWATEIKRAFRILNEDRMGSLNDMIRLQQAAIDMYSCRKFSDCGPMTIKAIETCLAVGVNCEPGQGYLDIIYPHYTPYEMETILAIVDRIHAHTES